MRIGIVSDSHDRAAMLATAVTDAKQAGAEAIIHCGDVIGTNTLRPLLATGLAVHVIHGNNLGDAVSLWRLCAESGGRITYHGQDADLRLGGRRLAVTHYPHLGRGWRAPAITTWSAAATATKPKSGSRRTSRAA